MNLVIKVLPLVLYLLVQFEFRIALRIFEAHLLINGDKIRKEQSVDAFPLIVRPHSDEQQVENLVVLPFQGAQKVIPAEGE